MSPQASPAVHVRRRSWGIAAVAAFVGIAAGTAAWRRAIAEPGPESPPVTVLVTTLEHQAADPGVVAMLEETVAQQVGVSPGLEVATPARVARTLRLMRRNTADPLTVTVGREQSGCEQLRASGEPAYFLGVERLAELHARDGRTAEATRLLADAAQQRERTFGAPPWTGAFRVRLNVRLVATYQRDGRIAEANTVRTALQGVLKHADADHPFADALEAP